MKFTEERMNCIEYVRQWIKEVRDLNDAEGPWPETEQGDDFHQTFDSIVRILSHQIAEYDSDHSHQDAKRALIFFLKGSISAIWVLHQDAALRNRVCQAPLEQREAQLILIQKLQELIVNVDEYPFPGDEEKIIPTTMRGVMGAMASGAYDD
jgi:hypothetical protein